MGENSFTTAEKITVKFNTATPYERMAAYIIDFMIKFCVLFVMLIVLLISGFSWTMVSKVVSDSAAGYVMLIYLVVMGVFYFFYNIIFEIAMKGQTPGKKALNIRVIMDNGEFITPYAAVMRNIFRIVDYLPIGYILGIILLFVTKNTQRVGDFTAKTLVISEERIPIPFAESNKVFPSLEMVDDLGDVVGENMRNAVTKYIISHKSLTKEAKETIQSKIIDVIVKKTGIEKPDDKEKHEFLIAVYNKMLS